MTLEPLLIEIGCEEIPARMIAAASRDLGRRIAAILDQAGLGHGETSVWGGPRRLAVRVESVEPRQSDRHERVIGPPVKVAFDSRGRPTRAASGFASKHGIDPGDLTTLETDRGAYAGFERAVAGRTLEQVLGERLPEAVATMWFPKTMRWGDGKPRWVRPVHWVLALHGSQGLDLELFGVSAGASSRGHRFKSAGDLDVRHADDYLTALEAAYVVADPGVRRDRLRRELASAAGGEGGRLVEDAELLAEAADLVEWPSVVIGRFSEDYLELPRELLVTTLRHHQKCFSIETEDGRLLPRFLAVSNNDRDPSGHVRRGNEWVVGGRLEDARFFWREDRKRPLEDRSEQLQRVVFHARLGSYADKARRIEDLAARLAATADLGGREASVRRAARLAKNDLLTGTVGEFPELQGQVGGLLLRAEGAAAEVAAGVYEHYRPSGAEDRTPESDVGAVISVADKLDSVAELIRIGEEPTGSRDPFGLRRATSGIFRILIERGWPLSLDALTELGRGDGALRGFLLERCRNFLREQGYSANEIQAVFRPRIRPEESLGWAVHDIAARLDALRPVRDREDFAHLVDLTKRVDNILSKNVEVFEKAVKDVGGPTTGFEELEPAALELWKRTERDSDRSVDLERDRRYDAVVDLLAGFVDPVERFFQEVLVIDPQRPEAMLHRSELLIRLREVLTRCFDIRELAGQAERRA